MTDILSGFKRVPLCHQPTALEEMPRLTAALGGPRLWIKRDDCTGLATGGNKTRKLEFLMADALDKGAEIVVTQGAVQSNHRCARRPLPASWGWNVMPCWNGASRIREKHMSKPAMCCLTICLTQKLSFPRLAWI